jgi:hypothetical protein
MLAHRRHVRSLVPGLLGLVLVTGFADRAAVRDADTDTDQDGVPDAVELDGIAGEPLLDFPAYGADPAQPDVFVQVDWVSCDPIVEYCGPNNSLDRNRMTARAAQEMAAYFAPDLAVHVDNGVAAAPELATLHGAWGGARRLPPGPQACNARSLGARFGYFHRGTVAGIGGGGGGALYGFCFGANTALGSVAAHELGHNFGLDHGGNAPSYPANCKPHYRSPMNYAYLYDDTLAQFSRGTRPMVMNPTAMDEQYGLGTTDPATLASLRGVPWYYDVRDDGAVDWNRDGRIDATPVRAAPTWAWSSCDQSTAFTDFFAAAREPSLVWLPAADQARLYMFARDAEGGLPGYRVATRFDGCQAGDEPRPCTDWSPGFDAATPIPDALTGTSAVAAVAWREGERARLLAVYADADGQLHEQVLTHEGGRERWSAPVAIAGARTDSSPALVILPGAGGTEPDAAPGTALLLAPEGGRLRAWTRDLGQDAWSAPVEQAWDDGAAIEPCHGAALARGFERGREGESVYVAIPTGRFCRLELGRLDAGGAWARLTSQVWPGAAPFAGGRPGLAYVPFRPGVPGEGRFFLAWKPLPTGAAVITFTQGNDLAPDATALRMELLPGAYLRNLWAIALGGVVLHHDPRFDDNLRAAYVHLSGGLQFLPFADGIIDADLYDQDDYDYILANLACSLTASCSR